MTALGHARATQAAVAARRIKVEQAVAAWTPPERGLWHYLIGLVQGDGYVRQRSPWSAEVVISGGGRAWGEAVLGVCRHLGIPARLTPEARDTWRIRFSGPAALGLAPWKAHGRWRVPEDLDVWAWLSGLIDTDGSVQCSRRRKAITLWQIANGNLDLVAERLTAAGIGFTRNTRRRRPHAADERLVIRRDAARVARRLALRHPARAATAGQILAFEPARNPWRLIRRGEADRVRVHALIAEGRTRQHIARALHMSLTTVTRFARKEGATRR